MKSPALIKPIYSLGVVILLMGVCTVLLAQEKVCNCNEPPGGSVTCEKDQIAICRIKDGKVFASCRTPPPKLSEVSRKVWILTQIKDSTISAQDLSSEENRIILETGQWKSDGTIALFTTQPKTQGIANVIGFWDMAIETPQGTNRVKLIIKQDNNKLVGMIESPRGERPFDSVTLKGDDITLTTMLNTQGQDISITYTGKAENGKMSGERNLNGSFSGRWSATAIAVNNGDKTNISGAWDFNVETPSGTSTPFFILNQEGEKITGTYNGSLGELPITGAVKGSDVTLTLKVFPKGGEITVTYTGKITSKDIMNGKASFGSLNEGMWSAKKKL